jgi:hypothetical protein
MKLTGSSFLTNCKEIPSSPQAFDLILFIAVYFVLLNEYHWRVEAG